MKQNIKRVPATAEQCEEWKVRLGDIYPTNLKDIPATPSFLEGINEYTGGYREGELTVWSGYRGHGKSIFLINEMVNHIQQGVPIFVFSGELSKAMFQGWCNVVAAGPDFVEMVMHPLMKREVPEVIEKYYPVIHEWYNQTGFYLYNNYDSTDHNIIDTAIHCVKKYGCKALFFDNLKVTNLSAGDTALNAQEIFVKRLKSIAEELKVHCHLVAHPRKKVKDQKRINDEEDISGSASLADIADNIITNHRFTEEEQAKEADKSETGTAPGNLITIWKTRAYGFMQEKTGIDYSFRSKRYYQHECPNDRTRKYGWIDLL